MPAVEDEIYRLCILTLQRQAVHKKELGWCVHQKMSLAENCFDDR